MNLPAVLLFISYFLNTFNCVQSRKVLTKCCLKNQILIVDYFTNKTCVPYNGSVSFSDFTIYNEDHISTLFKVDETFDLQPNLSFVFQDDVNVFPPGYVNHYLIMDGFLHLETPNAFKRWTMISGDKFCIELYKTRTSLGKPQVGFAILEEIEEPTVQDPVLTITAMYVSSFFFVLVLIAYSMLPELRNLHGIVLMAYVASMLAAFSCLATLQLLTYHNENSVNVCLIFSFLIHYFFLASFCWMNIMSFDIWWTFRGYAKARPIHRRGELHKFMVYCSYSFGVPLLMTAGLITLNTMDLKHIPWVITPKIPLFGCFLEGGERFLYLYVPMLIMLSVNWILFVMTAFNIWRLNRGTAVLNRAGNCAHRPHHQRFSLYLKLSLVMGINWVLEVLSLLDPRNVFWKITDSYNLLIGLAIFAIFICKRKIFNLLIKRLKGENTRTKSSWKGSSQRSVRSTCSSVLTNEPNISVLPKGT